MSLYCTLPCKLRSGDFLEPGKPADLWECSLGFSKNSEVFLVGKTTLSIKSWAHYLLGLINRHLHEYSSIKTGVNSQKWTWHLKFSRRNARRSLAPPPPPPPLPPNPVSAPDNVGPPCPITSDALGRGVSC